MEALDGLPPVKVHFPFWQKKQFMQHLGIMQKSIILKLKDFKSQRAILAKKKKQKNGNSVIQSMEGEVPK